MSFNPFAGNQKPVYPSVTGVIAQIQPMSSNGSRFGGCTQMITIEEKGGEITNFFITGNTYIVDFETLCEGMPVTAFYDGNQPAVMIYPPQFTAVAVAPRMEGQMVTVAYFNHALLAADQSLKLNLSPTTEVVTQNNQTFYGNPGGNTLLVLYRMTTRSIPPQTTPDKVIVLCGL